MNDTRSGPPEPLLPGRSRADPRRGVISLVLAIHAEADRPLGFGQVAGLAGHRVTRGQVSAASAALCRDGQLDRIRSGVYQWSAGQRAAARQIPTARRPAAALPPQAPLPPPPTGVPARPPGRMSAAELFSELFPSGVQLTGELLADLEQWARLTSKLAAEGGSTAV